MKNNKIAHVAFIPEMILLNKKPNMKKTSIRLVLAFACFSLILGACKKDKDESLAPSKENLVGSYKLVKAEGKAMGQTVDVMEEYAEPCQKDDVYVLGADFSVQVKDEGTKCDPESSYESTWSLDANYIDIAGYSGQIKSFSKSALVIEADYSQGTGIEATVTFHFQKL